MYFTVITQYITKQLIWAQLALCVTVNVKLLTHHWSLVFPWCKMPNEDFIKLPLMSDQDLQESLWHKQTHPLSLLPLSGLWESCALVLLHVCKCILSSFFSRLRGGEENVWFRLELLGVFRKPPDILPDPSSCIYCTSGCPGRGIPPQLPFLMFLTFFPW